MTRNNEEIEFILQVCIERIQRGAETIDSVLADFPELADVLRPGLEASLWLSARIPNVEPRPGFVSASRRRLVTRIQEEAIAAQQKPAERWKNAFARRWPFSLRRASFSFSLALILVAVFSLFVFSGGVVLAAQESLPGDALYPLKLTIEKVALAVTLDDTQDAALSLQFTERRSQEINKLIVSGRYDMINDTVEDLQSQVDQTIESLDNVSNSDNAQAQDLAESLKDILSDQSRYYSALIEKAPAASKPAIAKAIDVSKDGAEKAQDIIRKRPSATETSPSSVIVPTNTLVPTDTRVPPTRTPRPTPTIAPTQADERSELPTDAPLPSATVTRTPVPQPSRTPTPSPTRTPEPTETDTPTPTPTETETPTSPPTETNTPTPTGTPSPTPTDVQPAEPSQSPVEPNSTPTPISTAGFVQSGTETPTPDL